MTPLRLSYTLLRLWEQNKLDEVCAYVTKTSDQLVTDAVEQGSAWDKIVQESIEKDGKLPKEFGGMELEGAFCQEKKVLELNDFVLVAKPDIVSFEGEELYEIKTGKFSSGDYANTMQVPIYMMVFDTVKKATILHYDQAIDEMDWFLIHKTEALMEKTKEYVMKNGLAIKKYLEDQGIIEMEVKE